MNRLKRILGFVWLALAALSGYFGVTALGIPKLVSAKTDDLVFGIIVVFVLMPLIVGGLATFGYYAVRGEYDD
ncbi:DUF6814 family protein [Fibrella sp. WM1]|uniref:DUF6814 family protein n=1 Tax=Fibrella musci TaxID=3242485 RepID=UPI003520A174